MSEENIKNLLESVNEAINSRENNQKVKKNHGETFNVFSLCGVDSLRDLAFEDSCRIFRSARDAWARNSIFTDFRRKVSR